LCIHHRDWSPASFLRCSRFVIQLCKTCIMELYLHHLLGNLMLMESNWTFQSWRCSYSMNSCP
jgi:hypothetical protein